MNITVLQPRIRKQEVENAKFALQLDCYEAIFRPQCQPVWQA